MKKLSKIKVHKTVVIHSFTHKIIARKLITMGVIPGKEIEIVRKVPFSETYYIRVHETNLAIRRFEAENILIVD